MEPFAHTLAGACLSEAGLNRRSPLAASTLIVAANLPDLDGACYVHSADLAFAWRRGWTHGVLAMCVLPLLLAGAMLVIDRMIRRRRRPESERTRFLPLLALSVLGVLSHVFLDWLNNYGVRLLTPFSDRWFYGDALFIVDPWLWLLLGGAVMFAWTVRTRAIVAWILLATGTTALMMVSPLVSNAARVLWLGGVAGWIAARLLVPAARRQGVAVAAIIGACLYVGVMIAGSRLAERQVRTLAQTRGWRIERVAAMPVPAAPTRRLVIAVAADRYLFVPVDWTRGPNANVQPATEPRGPLDPIVVAALGSPSAQGVRRWLRFPSYEVHQMRDGHYRVTIRDARFAVGNLPGFGVVAIVDVDRSVHPVPTR